MKEDNEVEQDGESCKETVKEVTTIKTDHTSIKTVEVRDRGTVAIGEHATIIIKQESVKAKRDLWWKVPSPIVNFVGRTKQLDELHDKILRDQGSTVAITGLGGMGKSELAKKYAYMKSALSFDGNAVWIAAENTTSLANSFIVLSQYLGIEDKSIAMEARVERVYDYFRNVKSLFIFDNAERMSTISPFLPTANPVKNTPNVIITTQVTSWPERIGLIELGKLDEDEAICLITEDLQVDKNDAKLLADELQCFPLALRQATAYIKKFKRRKKFTISDYITEFHSKTKEVLDTVMTRGEYNKTVYATLSVTIDRLKESNNYELVIKVLATMAFMHADDIPVSTFMEYTNNNEDQVWDVLEVLEQYCLIKQTNIEGMADSESEATFGIHRLVQKVLKITLELNDFVLYLESTLKQMQHFVRGGYGNYSRDRQFMYHGMQVWDHAKEVESLRLKYCYLPIKIVDALLYQGRYSESFDYAAEEYLFLAKNLGECHQSTLAMIYNKARSYHCLSKLKEAVGLYNEAIGKQKETLGELHCDTLASEIDLGFCYIDLEQPEISLKLFTEAYNQKKRCEEENYSGKNDVIELYHYRDIYTAMYGMGHALQLLKRYDEAEAHYSTFYEQRRLTDGECHPRRLHAGNKLAEVKIEKGQYTEAKELLQYVYEKQLHKLGDSHPHCMMTLKNIVKCLKFKGEIEEARKILHELQHKVREKLGPEHMDTKKIEKMVQDFHEEYPSLSINIGMENKRS